MEIREFFKTNCSLRHNEFAYFVKLGNKFFCIGSNTVQEDYKIGGLYLFEDNEVQKIESVEQKSLIWKNFKSDEIALRLFNYTDILLFIAKNENNRDAYSLSCSANLVLTDFDI